MISEGQEKWKREKACLLLRKYFSKLVTSFSPLKQSDVNLLFDFDYSEHGGSWNYQGQDKTRIGLSLGYRVIDELVAAEIKNVDEISNVLASTDFLNNLDLIVMNQLNMPKIKGVLISLLSLVYAQNLAGGLDVPLADKGARLKRMNSYLNDPYLLDEIQPKVDHILRRIYRPNN